MLSRSRWQYVLWLSGLVVTVLVTRAAASDIGQLVADQVSITSYQHFLEDLLNTHDGNNWYAPDGPDDDPATWQDNDYRLAAGSPCIDAGDNAYAIGNYDLDGNSRVVDGDADDVAVVDMGAYEYSPVIEAADFDADGDVDLAASPRARQFGIVRMEPCTGRSVLP